MFVLSVSKKKLKAVNVANLVDFNNIIVNTNNITNEERRKLTKKLNEKINDEKHYHHYTRSTSYNCGGGSTSSSCGGSTSRSSC